jgi:hypothetical protein
MELFYLLFLSQNVRKMGMPNDRNRKMLLLSSIHLVAIIFTLTIIFASATTPISASTTGNTTTLAGGGEQEAVGSTTNTTTNNASNAVLGSLFSFGEGTEASVNPINETYSVISYLGNRIIMPPNAPGVVINATESGNLTVNLQPNGLSIEQGRAFIATEDGAAAEEEKEEENATLTFVSLGSTNPNGTGSRTGVAFYNTNSTGQLAFLENMVGIYQSESSPGGSRFMEWEWKGGTVPFEIGGGAPDMGNQTVPSKVR